MLHNKFVVYDGKIILGRVKFHKDLLPTNYDISLVNGGGYFQINVESKILKIYGRSVDFGKYPTNIKDLPFEKEIHSVFTIKEID